MGHQAQTQMLPYLNPLCFHTLTKVTARLFHSQDGVERTGEGSISISRMQDYLAVIFIRLLRPKWRFHSFYEIALEIQEKRGVDNTFYSHP